MALATQHKPPLTPLANTVVSVIGYFYAVELLDEAGARAGSRSSIHRVGKDRRCTCPKGSRCPAIAAVAAYLQAGGERTPDPPSGYYPVAPLICPICEAPAVFDLRLSSKQRGAGWRCKQAGSLHYWEAHVQVLRRNLAVNPWLFAPVVVRDGVQRLAPEGIQPGDVVLYPGVRREEVITQESPA
jgi:hypothetical protein